MTTTSYYLIGFARMYYTLWSVLQEEGIDEQGKFIRKRYSYIKNVSMDLAKVQESYPDVIIDENLHGSTSFTSIEREKKPVDNEVFQFGKYAGRRIDETSDIKYLEWYAGQAPSDNRQVCYRVLEAAGYKIKDDYIFDPERWTEIQRKNQESLNAVNQIKTTGYIDLIITGNAKESYENKYSIPTQYGYVEVQCEDVSYQYYNGYSYMLPVFGGKSKRLKNKTVRIYADTVKDHSYFLYNIITIIPTKIEVIK